MPGNLFCNQQPYYKLIELILPPKQTLPLVRPGFADVHLMKAIFGFAWAVAVVIE